MDINFFGIFFICIIAIFFLGKIFSLPGKNILKLLINSILGGFFIYIINIVGEVFNFHIGLTIVTSILVGILGVPGVVLLIILVLNLL